MRVRSILVLVYNDTFREREDKMKFKVKSVFYITFCVAIIMLSNVSVVAAYAQETNEGDVYINRLTGRSMEEGLLLTEEIVVQPRATSTVWNSTYTSEYNVKKSFTMATSLVSSGEKPYTTFTITNKGNTKITAIAYTGAVLGSKEIQAISIPANKTMSMTVNRGNIVNYGTKSQAGDRATLSYTISLYNENGNKISCDVKGIKYS